MIDPEVAIEIARKRSVEKDWEFAEPVEVVPYHRWFGGLDRFERQRPTQACWAPSRASRSTPRRVRSSPRAISHADQPAR
ncbi:MAG: hypothetical protein [Olavius algarvensis Gamma 1 endosymbiont]|nr:MAG: hypothetical protein [Olavius algarvensis Gamma 1 endosymbiont]